MLEMLKMFIGYFLVMLCAYFGFWLLVAWVVIHVLPFAPRFHQ
jgi:hypothetical protein